MMEADRAPRLLAVTPENAARDPGVARDWLTALLAGHRASDLPATEVCVQIRDKQADDGRLRSLVELVRGSVGEAGFRLSINGRVDLARSLRLDGVHLTAASGPPPAPPPCLRGRSTHRVDEVGAAASEGLDYVVFGPVFDTPSKRPYGAPRGLEELRRACRVDIPVLAIGGLDDRRAAEALAAGAWGIAAIRACGRSDRTSRLCRLLASHRRARSEARGP